MRKQNLLLILTFCVTTLSVRSQITLTNATFPVAGDTLKTANDQTPDGIVMDPPGGPYAWDYTSLSADSRDAIAFQPASTGSGYADFPTADLVSINNLGAETYYDVSASAFSNLGFSGGDITNAFPFITHVTFQPPIIERRNPTHFFDINQTQSYFYFAIATSDLPAGILDSLGIPSGLLDSLRIRLSFKTLDVIDAFGTLAIPGGIYNVLRQHTTGYTTTEFDAHSPFLGWLDVASLGIMIPGTGTDTTTTYSYYSDSAKEPIAVMTMSVPDGLVASDAVYKDNGVPNAVGVIADEKPDVSVSPNPASDKVTFKILNPKNDSYTLVVYDSFGRRLLDRKFNSAQETVSISSWDDGLYFYQIQNGQQHVVASGKLIKTD